MFACTCYNADLATFRVMFPGLSSVSDSDVQEAIDKAYCTLSDENWGDTLCQATLYLSAHNIAYLQNAAAASSVDANGFVVTNNTANQITGASAGGLSVSYQGKSTSASIDPFDELYESTPYGRVFLALKKSRMPRMLIGGAFGVCGVY